MRTSQHAKDRIVERDNDINSMAEAKKVAKLAFRSGKTINDFQSNRKFYNYLQSKKQESNTCRIRVYRGNIYMWKGSTKTLITCMPIPDEFKKELNND